MFSRVARSRANGDAEQVRSSIARRLGIDIGGLKAADCHVEGVVEMMLDATREFDQPLTDAWGVRSMAMLRGRWVPFWRRLVFGRSSGAFR